MRKELFKNALIVLLLTVTVFSGYKYFLGLKERYELLDRLDGLKQQVDTLAGEKQGLLEDLGKERDLQQRLIRENSGLKGYLKASRRRLGRLFYDYAQTEKEVRDLESRFSILKVENAALIEDKRQLATENEGLKVKLSSLAELNNAIHELKMQMHRPRRVKREEPAAAERKIAGGNRGYIIKDGKLTYPSKMRIEVVPALPAGRPAVDTHKE